MKKFYSLALAMTAALSSFAQVTIGETTYGSLREAVEAAEDGATITITGTVEVETGTDKRVNFPTGKTITIAGADETAQLKRKWKQSGVLFLANQANSNVTFKNLTFSGSTIDNPNSSFECSNGTAVMNFENVTFIEVNQTNHRTIDQKSSGTVNINGLHIGADCNFAKNGNAGWTIFEGTDKKVSITGTNNFCIYAEKDYLINVTNLTDCDIEVGFDPTNGNRFTSKRAIVRGTGDANQVKSGIAGYALEKEGNKDNLRIVLAPIALNCNGEELTDDHYTVQDNAEAVLTVTNSNTGIEYSYKFTATGDAEAQAEEGYTVFDPATGVTIDKTGELSIMATCATMNDPKTVTRTITVTKTSGIDEVGVDAENGVAEYYNLQGVRVENPTNGLFIKKQGSKVQKVIIK